MGTSGKNQRSTPARIRLKALCITGQQNDSGILRAFSQRVKHIVVAHLLEFPVLDRLGRVFLKTRAISVNVELFTVNVYLRAGIVENNSASFSDRLDKILVQRTVAEAKIILAGNHNNGNISAHRIEEIIKRVEIGSFRVAHISRKKDIVRALSSDLACKLGILVSERHAVQVAYHHELHTVKHTRQSVNRNRLMGGRQHKLASDELHIDHACSKDRK